MIETGVYFGDAHSFYDLDLILSSVNIPPATPKTNYIDIPGGDGSIDLTEAHGEIKYSDRNCSFIFTVSPEDNLTFEERKKAVSNILNGRKCKITLDKDSDYYYNGRLSVNQYKQDGNLKQITIDARVGPYKYKQKETVVTFAIDTTEKMFLLKNDRKSVVPKITCTAETTIIFDENTFTLAAGTHQILEICLVESENILKITGKAKGTVTFTYQEGAL